jgi:hypothetical protein
MKTTLTLLLCSLTLLAVGQKKETLALNLEKGVTYSQKIVNTNAISQQEVGQTMRIDETKCLDISLRVKEITDNGYDVEMTIENITIDITSNTGSQSLDTKNGMTRLLEAFKNNPVQVKMDKQGKILDLRVPAAIPASLEGQDGSTRQFRSLLDAEVLKKELEDIAAPFPDHPVAVGESWTRTFSRIPATSSTITYTFLGSENGCWKISCTGATETPDKEMYVQVNGMEVKNDISGTFAGEQKLEKKSGWVIDGNLSASLKGESRARANEQFPNGFTMNMESKSTSTLSGKISK